MATRRATATPATGARARARVVSAAAPRLPGAPPAGLYGRRPEGGRGAAAGRERQSQSRGGRARAMVSPPEPEAGPAPWLSAAPAGGGPGKQKPWEGGRQLEAAEG